MYGLQLCINFGRVRSSVMVNLYEYRVVAVLPVPARGARGVGGRRAQQAHRPRLLPGTSQHGALRGARARTRGSYTSY